MTTTSGAHAGAAPDRASVTFEFDRSGAFTAVSDGFCTVLGWRRDELLGSYAPSLVHPEDRGRLVAQGTGFVGGEGGFDPVWRVRHASGEYRWYRVDVTPLLDDSIAIDIKDSDVEIETMRSGGAGGQNVNKVASAIRITHIPTGVSVASSNQRSQGQNREQALRMLRSRLYEMELQKQQDALAKERRGQVGSGDRSEKIRTYNFPQSRITDHRVNFTTHQLTSVLNGDIAELLDAVITHYQAEKLKEATEKPDGGDDAGKK